MRLTSYFKCVFILLGMLIVLNACTGVNGSLTIYNKTGHNDLYVTTNKAKAYLADNKSLAVDVYNGESVRLTATKEEKNAAGVVTWRYKYEGQVYCNWDPQDWFFADNTMSFNLTSQLNQYK